MYARENGESNLRVFMNQAFHGEHDHFVVFLAIRLFVWPSPRVIKLNGTKKPRSRMRRHVPPFVRPPVAHNAVVCVAHKPADGGLHAPPLINKP